MTGSADLYGDSRTAVYEQDTNTVTHEYHLRVVTALADERNQLREALQQTVDLCNAMREYAPTINLAAEKQLRESLRLLNG